MHGVGHLARQLADDAQHCGAPDYPIRDGDEADALERAALKLADDPIDAEATAQLLRLAQSALRFHESSPDGPGSEELECRMRDLIDLFQSNVDREDRDDVADLTPDVVSEGERGEAVGNRFRGVMKRFGEPAYDIAVKILSDIGSATVKGLLGLWGLCFSVETNDPRNHSRKREKLSARSTSIVPAIDGQPTRDRSSAAGLSRT